jgi:hypothetical protein
MSEQSNATAAATKKIASIVSRAAACADDGRALGLEWTLFLNDNGGAGFWHGGPGRPDHGSVYSTEDEAKSRAQALGYAVVGVSWQ